MMKYIAVFFVLFNIQAFTCQVKVVPSGWSRFGDNCCEVLGALWLKHAYGFDIVSKKRHSPDFYEYPNLIKRLPFKIMDIRDKDVRSFKLDQIEALSRKVKKCSCKQQLFISIRAQILRMIRSQKNLSKRPSLKAIVDWSDEAFTAKVKKTFSALRKSSAISYPPKNRVCIAFHYREGGFFDSEAVKRHFVNKFFPFEFYLKALDEVMDRLQKKMPVYIGVFSDAVDSSFVDRIKNHVKNKRYKDVKVEYQSHRSDIFHDFFSMAEYDFMIRAHSNFPTCAEKIGRFVGACVLTRSFEGLDFYCYSSERVKALLKRINQSTKM